MDLTIMKAIPLDTPSHKFNWAQSIILQVRNDIFRIKLKLVQRANVSYISRQSRCSKKPPQLHCSSLSSYLQIYKKNHIICYRIRIQSKFGLQIGCSVCIGKPQMNDSWIRGYSEMVQKEVMRKNIPTRYNFRKYTFPFTLCGWINGQCVEYIWAHRHYGLYVNSTG